MKNRLCPMNLQLFAEPDNPQAANQDVPNNNPTDQQQDPEAQNDAPQGNQQQPGPQDGQQPPRTFSQADVDRIVADRLSRERRNFQQQIETARQEGRTEAERLAQMSAEERARHDQEQALQEAQRREQQLAQREAEITRRELRAQAIDTLISRDLPRELESVLDYSSADACNTSIANLERVYRAAVQQGVDARLRASGVNLPAPGGQPDYANMSDADYYAVTLKK